MVELGCRVAGEFGSEVVYPFHAHGQEVPGGQVAHILQGRS